MSPRATAPLGWSAPGLNQMGLIGQFAGFRPFEVMRNQGCTRVRASGVFELRINGGVGWNAVLQTIPVRPFTDYALEGDLKTLVNTAFFGARLPGEWPPREQHFGPTPPNTTVRLRQPFNSGPNTSVTIFSGFWGTGAPHFMVVDNIVVLSR